MFRPLFVFIGTRYTRAKRRNHFVSFISLTSMIGLALGVVVMIVVLSVMNGFDHEMRTRVLGMVPHATVESATPIKDWRSLADQAQRNQQVLAEAEEQINSLFAIKLGVLFDSTTSAEASSRAKTSRSVTNPRNSTACPSARRWSESRLGPSPAMMSRTRRPRRVSSMAVSMLRSARFSGDRRPQCTSKMSLSPSRFVRNVWSNFAG